MIGIGSGSTIVYAVDEIAKRVKNDGLRVKCIPTSYQAKSLIQCHKLCLTDLEENPVIDVTIDGADEVDSKRVLIKGGGACLTQEKIVATASKKLIIVADISKQSDRLKRLAGIPVEVIPMSHAFVNRKITEKLGGKCVLRMGHAKAGPVVTDNSNFIIDWHFDASRSHDWTQVETTLNMIPGVVDNGLFVNMDPVVYFGKPDGTVVTMSAGHTSH